jgi:uncharacterized membrane protein YbhN (UPF0104 family)
VTDDAVPSTGRMRRVLSLVARLLFVVLVIGFAVWSFRDDWPAIGRSVADTPAWAFAGAIALIAVGIVASLPMWLTFARSFGFAVPVRTAAGILFVGQLGKYIPGSVWTVAAQAQLLRAVAIPVRTSVTIGLLYIGAHLASSLSIGAFIALAGGTPWEIPWWLCLLVAVAAAATLSPPALNLIGRLVAGRAAAPHVSWRGSLIIAAAMCVVWASWSGASVLLAGSTRWQPETILAIVGAVVIGYCLGALVIIAPAGIGVREAVVIAITAPVIGGTSAVALALLSRLVSAIADFGTAGVAWLVTRDLRSSASPTSASPHARR